MRGHKVIVFAAVLFFLAAVLILLLGRPFHSKQTETEVGHTVLVEDEEYILDKSRFQKQELGGDSPQNTNDTETEEVINIENVPVYNNSPVYDLKVKLQENTQGQVYLVLEYFSEGVGISKKINEEHIPEIKYIFKKRSSSSPDAGEGKKGYCVKAAYLNPKYSKVYFMIEGKSFEKEASEMSIYSYDFNSSSTEKIFSAVGVYTGLHFTNDFEYMGFSYCDLPVSSVFQEESLLQILNCKTNRFIVKNSRHLNGKTIGKNRAPELVYSYTFLSWESKTVARLKEKALTRDCSKLKEKQVTEKEVLYDIQKDLFLNTDGSVIPVKGIKEDSKTTTVKIDERAETKDDVEKEGVSAQEVLKAFYRYLSSADLKQYKNAMNLLDDNFTLKMEIFRQFGISEVRKNDIDPDSVSVYKDILKSAKLKNITNSENSGDICTIDYVQGFSMGEGVEYTQMMTAKLKRNKSGWKILLISEKNQKND